ncbi:SA1362 family protein [Halalkalibacillus halophilus]|uniref:SA1362 family protein n=1 Tax=Halalkalibacillus halophilus TaxID=392827 RepID=UPI000416603D|nr:SA1362 family protein [Halalkalibacillus halophilus]
MRSSKISWIIIIIGILAVIGLFGNLITNPLGFLQSIFTMIGIAAVIGLLVYFLLIRKRTAGNPNYRKAVKQSKQRYGSADPKLRNNNHIKKPVKLERKKSKQSKHLKVIKGNKK